MLQCRACVLQVELTMAGIKKVLHERADSQLDPTLRREMQLIIEAK